MRGAFHSAKTLLVCGLVALGTLLTPAASDAGAIAQATFGGAIHQNSPGTVEVVISLSGLPAGVTNNMLGLAFQFGSASTVDSTYQSGDATATGSAQVPAITSSGAVAGWNDTITFGPIQGTATLNSYPGSASVTESSQASGSLFINNTTSTSLSGITVTASIIPDMATHAYGPGAQATMSYSFTLASALVSRTSSQSISAPPYSYSIYNPNPLTITTSIAAHEVANFTFSGKLVGTASVPEPSTLVNAVFAMPLGLVYWVCRRRATRLAART